jgi:hypothetical protein
MRGWVDIPESKSYKPPISIVPAGVKASSLAVSAIWSVPNPGWFKSLEILRAPPAKKISSVGDVRRLKTYLEPIILLMRHFPQCYHNLRNKN